MALTKVTGPGIVTTTNLRVGILTADNISVGGTITYEDVTEINAVGVVTAQGGLHVGAGGTIIHALRGAHNGKVGIGTTNPTKLLELFGTDPTLKLMDSSGDAYALIEGDSADQGSFRFRADPTSAGGSTHIRFDVDGAEAFRIAPDGDVTVTSADAGATGPTLKLLHDSASPADNDIISSISMSGDDDGGNETEYAAIKTKVTDVSGGVEQSHLSFYTRGLNSWNEIFRLNNRSTASAPSYTTDDHNGIILDVYNTGNPYPRYMNIIAKSAGDTDSNILFWTESVGGSPTEKMRITADGNIILKDGAAQGNSLVNYIRANDSSGNSQYQLGMVSSGNEDLYLVQSRNANLRFQTSGSTRWKIDGDPGHLLPEVANTIDIGSASNEIRHLYIGDSGRIRLGSDQDMLVFHDNIHGYVSNRKNNLYLEAPNSVQIASTDTNGSNQQISAKFLRAGASDLYHANTIKFSTSSTGVSVTGEVAATQDYPNIRPTLDFNFAATKKLDPRINFRRIGPASYVDENGLVKLVGEDVPRFDHDPITGESKGLLIEEDKTNINQSSAEQWIMKGWAHSRHGYERYESETAPDGSTNAMLTYPNTTDNGSHYSYISSAGSSLTGTRTISAWFKNLGTTIYYPQLRTFGRGNGVAHATFVLTGDGTVSSAGSAKTGATITKYPNGWYRCTLSWNDGTGHYGGGWVIGNHTSNELPSYVADTNKLKGFLVWGFQSEAGPRVTSLIPTSGIHKARGWEVPTITGTDLTDTFNPTEGTMFYEASVTDLTNDNQPIVAFRDVSSTTASYHAMGHAIGGSVGHVRVWARDASSNNIHLTSHSGLVAGNFYRHMYGYAYNNYSDAFVQGATTSTTDTTSGNHAMIGAGVIDELRFGGYYSGPETATYSLEGGHIKRFSYWKTKLTNTQIRTYVS